MAPSSDWEQWRLLEAVVSRRNLRRAWSDDGSPSQERLLCLGAQGSVFRAGKAGNPRVIVGWGVTREEGNQTQRVITVVSTSSEEP